MKHWEATWVFWKQVGHTAGCWSIVEYSRMYREALGYTEMALRYSGRALRVAGGVLKGAGRHWDILGGMCGRLEGDQGILGGD